MIGDWATMSGWGALGRDSLLHRLAGPFPIVEGLRDADAQVQPNGIDLTIEEVWQLATTGAIGGPSPGRRLPERTPVAPTSNGWYRLSQGPYLVSLHERVRIPVDLTALALPRSTLLRCGAMLYTAVWDAGYFGRAEALLVVANPAGIELAADAAICQLVFFTLTEQVEAYRGAYQEYEKGEGV